jgi:clan AA aspartic protease (TIGR02281 family)
MRRASFIFAVSVIALLTAATTPLRADTSPDAVFHQLGLQRDGKWLVLPAENELHQRIWKLQQSDESVRGSTSTHRSLRPELVRGYDTLDKLAEQRNSEIKILDGLKTKNDEQTIDIFNSTLAHSDLLWSQFIKEDEMIDGLIEREGQVEEARAHFIGGVMDAQAKADAIAKAYAQLSQNADLTAAITQANADAQPPLTLGPSMAFTNDQAFLLDASQKIVTASILVPKSSEIGGLHVLPIINGKKTISMVWDSGCSFTELSSETARALGLKLTDHNPTTEAIIANGTKIKGKIVFLDSVQLGPFTMHDVLCDVSLNDRGDAPDLLGNSFQSHFLSRLDQQTGQLQLTPIDSSVDIGSIAEPGLNAATHTPAPQNRPPAHPKDFDLARLATATASSTLDGSDPHGAIDGIIAGAPDNPHNEWACDQPTGSITLTWDQPVTLSSAKLWDRVDGTDHIVTGQLVFDDGSTVPFGELPTDGSPLALRFAARTAKWIRFEILTVSPGTQHPGFAEISLFE